MNSRAKELFKRGYELFNPAGRESTSSELPGAGTSSQSEGSTSSSGWLRRTSLLDLRSESAVHSGSNGDPVDAPPTPRHVQLEQPMSAGRPGFNDQQLDAQFDKLVEYYRGAPLPKESTGMRPYTAGTRGPKDSHGMQPHTAGLNSPGNTDKLHGRSATSEMQQGSSSQASAGGGIQRTEPAVRPGPREAFVDVQHETPKASVDTLRTGQLYKPTHKRKEYKSKVKAVVKTFENAKESINVTNKPLIPTTSQTEENKRAIGWIPKPLGPVIPFTSRKYDSVLAQIGSPSTASITGSAAAHPKPLPERLQPKTHQAELQFARAKPSNKPEQSQQVETTHEADWLKKARDSLAPPQTPKFTESESEDSLVPVLLKEAIGNPSPPGTPKVQGKTTSPCTRDVSRNDNLDSDFELAQIDFSSKIAQPPSLQDNDKELAQIDFSSKIAQPPSLQDNDKEMAQIDFSSKIAQPPSLQDNDKEMAQTDFSSKIAQPPSLQDNDKEMAQTDFSSKIAQPPSLQDNDKEMAQTDFISEKTGPTSLQDGDNDLEMTQNDSISEMAHLISLQDVSKDFKTNKSDSICEEANPTAQQDGDNDFEIGHIKSIPDTTRSTSLQDDNNHSEKTRSNLVSEIVRPVSLQDGDKDFEMAQTDSISKKARPFSLQECDKEIEKTQNDSITELILPTSLQDGDKDKVKKMLVRRNVTFPLKPINVNDIVGESDTESESEDSTISDHSMCTINGNTSDEEDGQCETKEERKKTTISEKVGPPSQQDGDKAIKMAQTDSVSQIARSTSLHDGDKDFDMTQTNSISEKVHPTSLQNADKEQVMKMLDRRKVTFAQEPIIVEKTVDCSDTERESEYSTISNDSLCSNDDNIFDEDNGTCETKQERTISEISRPTLQQNDDNDVEMTQIDFISERVRQISLQDGGKDFETTKTNSIPKKTRSSLLQNNDNDFEMTQANTIPPIALKPSLEDSDKDVDLAHTDSLYAIVQSPTLQDGDKDFEKAHIDFFAENTLMPTQNDADNGFDGSAKLNFDRCRDETQNLTDVKFNSRWRQEYAICSGRMAPVDANLEPQTSFKNKEKMDQVCDWLTSTITDIKQDDRHTSIEDNNESDMYADQKSCKSGGMVERKSAFVDVNISQYNKINFDRSKTAHVITKDSCRKNIKYMYNGGMDKGMNIKASHKDENKKEPVQMTAKAAAAQVDIQHYLNEVPHIKTQAGVTNEELITPKKVKHDVLSEKLPYDFDIKGFGTKLAMAAKNKIRSNGKTKSSTESQKKMKPQATSDTNEDFNIDLSMSKTSFSDQNNPAISFTKSNDSLLNKETTDMHHTDYVVKIDAPAHTGSKLTDAKKTFPRRQVFSALESTIVNEIVGESHIECKSEDSTNSDDRLLSIGDNIFDEDSGTCETKEQTKETTSPIPKTQADDKPSITGLIRSELDTQIDEHLSIQETESNVEYHAKDAISPTDENDKLRTRTIKTESNPKVIEMKDMCSNEAGSTFNCFAKKAVSPYRMRTRAIKLKLNSKSSPKTDTFKGDRLSREKSIKDKSDNTPLAMGVQSFTGECKNITTTEIEGRSDCMLLARGVKTLNKESKPSGTTTIEAKSYTPPLVRGALDLNKEGKQFGSTAVVAKSDTTPLARGVMPFNEDKQLGTLAIEVKSDKPTLTRGAMSFDQEGKQLRAQAIPVESKSKYLAKVAIWCKDKDEQIGTTAMQVKPKSKSDEMESKYANEKLGTTANKTKPNPKNLEMNAMFPNEDDQKETNDIAALAKNELEEIHNINAIIENTDKAKMKGEIDKSSSSSLNEIQSVVCDNESLKKNNLKDVFKGEHIAMLQELIQECVKKELQQQTYAKKDKHIIEKDAEGKEKNAKVDLKSRKDFQEDVRGLLDELEYFRKSQQLIGEELEAAYEIKFDKYMARIVNDVELVLANVNQKKADNEKLGEVFSQSIQTANKLNGVLLRVIDRAKKETDVMREIAQRALVGNYFLAKEEMKTNKGLETRTSKSDGFITGMKANLVIDLPLRSIQTETQNDRETNTSSSWYWSWRKCQSSAGRNRIVWTRTVEERMIPADCMKEGKIMTIGGKVCSVMGLTQCKEAITSVTYNIDKEKETGDIAKSTQGDPVFTTLNRECRKRKRTRRLRGVKGATTQKGDCTQKRKDERDKHQGGIDKASTWKDNTNEEIIKIGRHMDDIDINGKEKKEKVTITDGKKEKSRKPLDTDDKSRRQGVREDVAMKEMQKIEKVTVTDGMKEKPIDADEEARINGLREENGEIRESNVGDEDRRHKSDIAMVLTQDDGAEHSCAQTRKDERDKHQGGIDKASTSKDNTNEEMKTIGRHKDDIDIYGMEKKEKVTITDGMKEKSRKPLDADDKSRRQGVREDVAINGMQKIKTVPVTDGMKEKPMDAHEEAEIHGVREENGEICESNVRDEDPRHKSDIAIVLTQDNEAEHPGDKVDGRKEKKHPSRLYDLFRGFFKKK